MEKRKRNTMLWAIAAAALALSTLLTVVFAMGGSPAVLVSGDTVKTAAEEMLDCARTGDFETLSGLLYGTPNLGKTPEKDGSAESMILQAYLESIQCEMSGDCYGQDGGVAVDARVTCLDITAVTDALEAAAPALMAQKASEMEREEIYDEENNYREAFVADVLREATAQVLAENPAAMSRELTFQFRRQDGRWLVVPTEEVQQLLSGFIAG